MSMINGIVASGLGEGKPFLSMQQYNAQIMKKLGFAPFEGTLNIKFDEKAAKGILEYSEKIKISGFREGNNYFGAAYCVKAALGGIRGAIIIPEKTRHENMIEFIAPVNLREKLNLKDNDRVSIELK